MLTCDLISYKDRFSGLGFSLIPGALLALYGKDATGVIMLLAGILTPTSGTVLFEDVPIRRSKDYKELSLYIPNADYQSRAGGNLSFFGQIKGILDARFNVERTIIRLAKAGGGAPELAEAAMRYWGLENHRKEKCSALPLHLQKRIILTQLLTHPRPVWLLDYPEQHLDEEGLNLLDTVIANRSNQDGIVVMSTQRSGFMNHLPSLTVDDWKPLTLEA